MDPWLAFATPVIGDERAGWLKGAERGAAYGLAAIALGSGPSMLVYLWRYWELLPPALIAQAATFVMITGLLWGGCVGAALGALPRERGGGRPLAHAACGAVAGAIGCGPSGAIGAMHFGQMATPYFGGIAILLSAAATILLAGLLFARLCGPPPFRLAWRSALAGAPLLLLLLLPLAALPTAAVLLRLDAMRVLAAVMGLAPLGMGIAATMGAFGGAWMGLTVSRSASKASEPMAPHRIASEAIRAARARQKRGSRRLM